MARDVCAHSIRKIKNNGSFHKRVRAMRKFNHVVTTSFRDRHNHLTSASWHSIQLF